MKKGIRIIGIVLAALLLLFFAACLIAPKFAGRYIEGHSREWIGRKIQIGSISFNPFRFTVRIENFDLFENDDTTKFVSFREFFVNVDPSCLLVGDICLSEVRMDSPFARVVKNGEHFNFSDILDRFAVSDSSADSSSSKLETLAEASETDSVQTQKSQGEKSPQEQSSSDAAGSALPLGISIRQIAVLSGNVIFEDGEVQSHLELKDFSVRVPEVYFSDKKTSAGLELSFASGGALKVFADYNMQQGNFGVRVKLSDFSMGAVQPYLKTALQFQDLSGKVGVDISATGNVKDVLSASVKGSVSVDDVVLTETSGKTLEVAHLGVGIGDVNLGKNRFVLDSLTLRRASAHFDLYKNSNNIQVFLTPKNSSGESGEQEFRDSVLATSVDSTAVKSLDVNSEKSPNDSLKNELSQTPSLQASLAKLSVSETKFTFNDNTIPGGFSYTVSGIALDASNIALDKQVSLLVHAALPHGGSVKVSAKMQPSDRTSLQANIDVKNVNMADFSKYSEHYTGYPLVAGSLGFASDNVIRHYEIDSRNNIDIYNLTVGDKPSDAKPEYTVPMKIALYILKDKDGKIAFDIPVKGNLQDPEFSYGKIVWQTLVNLLVKVALSPAKLIFGNSTPSDFAFDIAADDFTSEQYGIAQEWTKVLSLKPGSKLTVVQVYNPKKQQESFLRKMEKLEFYRAQTGKANLTPVERKAALEAKDDDAFKQFQETWKRPSDKELLEMLNRLAQQRNEKLQKILATQDGVSAQNLKVRLATAEERRSIGNKSVFRMSVQLP